MTLSFLIDFANNYTNKDSGYIKPDWSANVDLNQEFRQRLIDYVVEAKAASPILTRDLLDSESDYCLNIMGSTPQLRKLGEVYFELTKGRYTDNYEHCRAKSFDCGSALSAKLKSR